MPDQNILDWDEEFDFVTIGSGGGAIVASLVLQDAGFKPLIVEKQEKVGGSTGYSGGAIWIPNCSVLKRSGVDDSYERARTYLDAATPYQGPGSTPERRKAYLESGPEMVDYLESKGMKFKHADGWSDYYDELPGGEPRGRSLLAELFNANELGEWKQHLSVYPGMTIPFGPDDLTKMQLAKATWKGKIDAALIAGRYLLQRILGRDPRGAGGALQGRMLQIALREGISIYRNCPVDELVSADGSVVGVKVRLEGEVKRIRSRRGVLVNAGGFARNDAMRKKYGRAPSSTKWTLSNPGDTGEVLERAIELGAATDCMDTAIWAAVSLGPSESYPKGAFTKDGRPLPFMHHFDMSLPHCIVVDQDGARFCNEAASYMEVGEVQYEHQAKTGKAIPAWFVMDGRHRRKYFWGPVPGPSPGSWFESGYMKKAKTLDDLADQIDVNRNALRETVSRFNQFCEDGEDRDFGRGANEFNKYHGDPSVKPNPNLGPIEKGPFYAVAMYPGDVGTFGGLVTDVDARVLREDGSVIDGLYATGNSTASVMGRTYIGGGTSIGASFIFGYRAAIHSTRKAKN